MNGVVILSSSNYSLYSIMVAEELIARGVSIDRIVIKKLFNIKRIWLELKAGPSRFLRKVINKLVLRGVPRDVSDEYSINKKFSAGGYKTNSLNEVGDLYGIPVTYCDDFHSEKIISLMSQSNPILVAFTGGGIVRRALLDIPRIGVVNCHMGILPEYRGMDCYVWAILNGEFEKIGLTTHLMDAGIDTGPILDKLYLPMIEMDSIPLIESALEANMPDLMVQTIIDIINDNKRGVTQQAAEGKQYFVPADSLLKYAENLVEKRKVN